MIACQRNPTVDIGPMSIDFMNSFPLNPLYISHSLHPPPKPQKTTAYIGLQKSRS